MEIAEIFKSIFNFGGTVVMAGLFIWVFITDKTKNNTLLENNSQMLKALAESNKNIAEGNINIAKSLDIISKNLVALDNKADRNYEAIMMKGK